jgi:DNA-binding winged helix-turn-helix (wHTH) protein
MMTQDDASMPKSSFSYVFGRFRLHVGDENQLTLFSDEHKVKMRTVEAMILRMLLDEPGKVRTTSWLLNAVNQSPKATDNLVHGAIASLRRTLNDEDIIKNEWGTGYYLTYSVEIRFDPELLNTEPPGVSQGVLPPTNGERGQTAVTEKPQVTTEVQVSTQQPDPFVFMATIVSLAVLALPFLLATASGGWENVPKQIGFIQALVICVGIFFSSHPSRDAEAVSKPDLIAVGQLQRSWRWLLISWSALYLTLAISKVIGGSLDSFTWIGLQVLNTFLNSCSALIFALCYLVLNRRTVIPVNGQYVDDLPWKGWLIIVGAVSCVEISLIVLFGTLTGTEGIRAVIFGADLLSGCLTGIAMALFISRLDSRILAGNQLLPIVPILLYFYVVIQPFYPLLNWPFDRPNKNLLLYSGLILMELAFLLKSIMYIYVVRLFRSERFPRYMKHARRFYEEIEKELSGAMPNPDGQTRKNREAYASRSNIIAN